MMPDQQHHGQRQLSIFVGDDEEAFCTSLRKYFEKKGHSVECAYSYETARDKIFTKRYDIVFLDNRLEDGIGRDILHDAKQQGITTPFVMMSAYKTRDNEIEIKQLGAAFYLAKPVKTYELDTILETCLSNT